jgi:hypothetical protein
MSTHLNDVAGQALVASGLDPQELTATTAGDGIDLLAADGHCFAVQAVGAVSGTTPSLAGKVQESEDNIAWSDVSGAAFSAVTGGPGVQVISFTRTKRFARYHATLAGTTPSFFVAALIGEQRKTV